ncbi:hypothetical protein EGW08_009295 [Elysia chlorotica]|uniref:CTCK domain-containing protein n=1 Tax=Elysia chlorotica TaxID=188477 RepID=A0A433TN45_ELYCH|nr:hypothetical protein EGW08_009295 [Elysia chlorotica]
MKESSCAGLVQEGSCEEKCACKEGYLRNANGECVMKDECECYEGVSGTTPIPQGFHVNVGNCVFCQCTAGGYICTEREDCCEIGEWSEWSSCSVQCGEGNQTRTREKYGKGCPNDTTVSEDKKCVNDGCPCVHRGKVFEANTPFEDSCKKCECLNGQFQCTPTKEEDELFPNDACTHMCYCNATGDEICPQHLPPSCKAHRESCNNSTHVQRPTDNPCCPDCVPIMQPCVMSSIKATLNTIHPVHGSCQSQNEIEINSCSGSCGASSETSVELMYRQGRFQLSTESGCSCCTGTHESKDQSFVCNDGAVIKIAVDSITGCGCQSCGGN